MTKDYEQLLKAIIKAKSDDDSKLDNLVNLFVISGNEDGKKDIQSYKEELSTITLDDLVNSLAISSYECNHEMRKKINKYFHQLVATKIADKDTSIIINLIINDKALFKYIKRNNRIEDYIKRTTNSKKNNQPKLVKKNIESKSFVIM